MSLQRSLGIALRIILSMRRDHRTLALMVVAPLVIMSLIGLSFNKTPQVLDFAAPAIMSVFALLFSFILTGISFLRERLGGTLERLLATPIGRGDLLFGYLVGFLGFALLQSLIVQLYTVYVLHVTYRSTFWEVFVFVSTLTIAGVSLGIFISVFARNEFQVIQFLPLFLAPQIFLSGVFLPVDQMPRYLQVISTVMPLRYAIDGLRGMMLQGKSIADVSQDILILGGIALIALGLAGTTVRKA